MNDFHGGLTSPDIYPSGNMNQGYFGTGRGAWSNVGDPRIISGTFGSRNWAAKMADITDGPSNTIAFGEVRKNCGEKAWFGIFFGDRDRGGTMVPINFPMYCRGESGVANLAGPQCRHNNGPASGGFRSRHPGGAQLVMCDGHARFISEDIDYDVYQRLGDRRDNLVVPEF